MTFFLMSLVMNLVLFPVLESQALLIVVGVHGFFTLGLWAWATIWLPELFPTRMRATAMAFCGFNAPRLVAAMGPLVAGALIVMLGGMGVAAAIVGSFYALGLVMNAVPARDTRHDAA